MRSTPRLVMMLVHKEKLAMANVISWADHHRQIWDDSVDSRVANY